MELLVQDAAAGGHPLHIARADMAAGAGRVLVLDFAVVNDGDRLEAAMRMLADPARAFGRLEVIGPAWSSSRKGLTCWPWLL
jgi:hypothetical protein